MGNNNSTIQSQKLPQHNALDVDDYLEAIDLDEVSDLPFPVDDRPDSTPRSEGTHINPEC